MLLNPSSKGASTDDVLAAISRLKTIQDDDAFCRQLAECDLTKQERTVDVRDWVAVVERINDILERSQQHIPNALDDPTAFVQADAQVSTNVKLCLSFCVGLLTNAQYKRLFWRFSNLKRLLGAIDSDIVQLTLDVLFAYSIPLSEVLIGSDDRHDDIEVETEIAEQCAQMFEGLRLIGHASHLSCWLGRHLGSGATTIMEDVQVEFVDPESQATYQISLSAQHAHSGVASGMKHLAQQHSIPPQHRLSISCACRALAAKTWTERNAVARMQLLCLFVLIHSKLSNERLVQLVGRGGDFVKDLIVLADPSEATLTCDVPLSTSILAMECLVALINNRRETLTLLAVEKQLGLIEGGQEGLLQACIIHSAVLASGSLPNPTPASAEDAKRTHSLSLEGLTGSALLNDHSTSRIWQRESLRYVGVSFDLLSAAVHIAPGGQPIDQNWLIAVETAVVPIVVDIARACMLPDSVEPGEHQWTLGHALRILETMLYKGARQQFDQVGGMELLSAIMERFQAFEPHHRITQAPSTHCVVENVLGTLMALMADSSRWATINDATSGIQQIYQPAFASLARFIFAHPVALGEQTWTFLVQLLRASIEIDPGLVTHFIDNGFVQLFVASVQANALLQSTGCVNEGVIELIHAFCLTQAGKGAVLSKGLIQHVLDALVHSEHLLPMASNPIPSSTVQSIGKSLLALCADVAEAVEELGRATKSHLRSVIQGLMSSAVSESEEPSNDLSMAPPRMLYLQKLTNLLFLLDGVLNKQHRLQVNVVDGLLDEEILELLVNCYEYIFPPGLQLFAQLSAQSNVQISHYGFFPAAKFLTAVLKAVVQASPAKVLPTLFRTLENQLSEVAAAKAALLAHQGALPHAELAASVPQPKAGSKKGRRHSKPSAVIVDGVLAAVPDVCPFESNLPTDTELPLDALHGLAVNVATIEWLIRLLGPALRPAQYAPGQASKVFDAAKDTLRRVFAFHRSSLHEVLQFAAGEIAQARQSSFTTTSNPGWPLAALAHMGETISEQLFTIPRVPSEFLIRVVHPAGAYIREQPSIDGSRIVMVAPFGAVLVAYERQVNKAGIMRYRTEHGWMSEYRREPKKEPIVEVLSIKYSDQQANAELSSLHVGQHVLTCREVFRCLLSRLLDPIAQVVVSLSRSVVARRQETHFHLPQRAHGEDVRLADAADSVASSLGKIVNAYINEALLQDMHAQSDATQTAAVLYTHTAFNVALSALLDDRRLRVNTFVMRGFVQHGGLESILKAANVVFQAAFSAVEHATSQQKTLSSASLSDLQRTALSALPNILFHLQRLVTLDGFMNSPVTIAIRHAGDKDSDMTVEHTFRNVLIAVGEKFLPIIQHPAVGLLPPQSLKALFQLWTILMNSIRDVPRESPPKRERRPSVDVLRTPRQPSIRGQLRLREPSTPPARFRVDPTVVEMLSGMGFSAAQVSAAGMALSSNDPTRIMEHLLTAPSGQSSQTGSTDETSEEDELMRAIALSMQAVDAPATESVSDASIAASMPDAPERQQEHKVEESLEDTKEPEGEESPHSSGGNGSEDDEASDASEPASTATLNDLAVALQRCILDVIFGIAQSSAAQNCLFEDRSKIGAIVQRFLLQSSQGAVDSSELLNSWLRALAQRLLQVLQSDQSADMFGLLHLALIVPAAAEANGSPKSIFSWLDDPSAGISALLRAFCNSQSWSDWIEPAALLLCQFCELRKADVHQDFQFPANEPIDLEELDEAFLSTILTPAVPIEERRELVAHIAKLLAAEQRPAKPSAVHAVLNLLLSLLSDRETHATFKEHGDFNLLLQLDSSLRFDSARQVASSIARQLIEDVDTLAESMACDIAAILRAAKSSRHNNQQARPSTHLSLRIFLLKTTQLFVKSPAAFLQAIKQCCEFQTTGDQVFVHQSRKPHPANYADAAQLLEAHPTWSLIGDLTNVAIGANTDAQWLTPADALHVLADIVSAAPTTRECVQAQHVSNLDNSEGNSVVSRLVEIIVDRCQHSPASENDSLDEQPAPEVVGRSQAAARLVSVLVASRSSARDAVCGALTKKLKDLSANRLNTDAKLLQVKTLCFLIVHLCTGSHGNKLDGQHRMHLDIVQSLLSFGLVEVATSCLSSIDLSQESAPDTVRANLELLEFISRPSIIRSLRKRKEAAKAVRSGRAHTLDDEEPDFAQAHTAMGYDANNTLPDDAFFLDTQQSATHAGIAAFEDQEDEGDGEERVTVRVPLDDEEEEGEEEEEEDDDDDDDDEAGGHGRDEEQEGEREGDDDDEEDDDDDEEGDDYNDGDENVHGRNVGPRFLSVDHSFEEDDASDEDDVEMNEPYDLRGEDEEALGLEDFARHFQRAVDEIAPRHTDVVRRSLGGDLTNRSRVPEDFVTPPNQVRSDPVRAWMSNAGIHDYEQWTMPEFLHMRDLFAGQHARAYEQDGDIVFEISQTMGQAPRVRQVNRLNSRRNLLPSGSSGQNAGFIEPPRSHPLLASIVRREPDRTRRVVHDPLSEHGLFQPTRTPVFAGRHPGAPDTQRRHLPFTTIHPNAWRPHDSVPNQNPVSDGTAPRLTEILQRHIAEALAVALEPALGQQTDEETTHEDMSAFTEAPLVHPNEQADPVLAAVEEVGERLSGSSNNDDVAVEDAAGLPENEVGVSHQALAEIANSFAESVPESSLSTAGHEPSEATEDTLEVDAESPRSEETRTEGDAKENEAEEMNAEAAAAAVEQIQAAVTDGDEKESEGADHDGTEGERAEAGEVGLACPPDYDAEVFAALPEFMQREIVEQYEQSRDRSMDVALAAGLDPEALAALPDAIREEVLEQARREQQAQAGQDAPADPANATEMDNASFLASLTPELRAEVLMQSDPAFLASLPPDMIAEAQLLRERIASRWQARHPVDRPAARIAEAQEPSEPEPTPEELHPGQMQAEVEDADLNVLPSRFLAAGTTLLYQRRSHWGSHLLERCFLHLARDPTLRIALLRLLLALLEPGQQTVAHHLLQDLCHTDDLPEQFPPNRLLGPRSPRSVRKVDGELISPHETSTPTEAIRAALNSLSHLVSNSGRFKHSALLPVDDSAVSYFERLISLLEHGRFTRASDIVDDLMRLLDTISSPLDSVLPSSDASPLQEAQPAASETEAKEEPNDSGEHFPQRQPQASGPASDSIWLDVPQPELQDSTLFLLCGVLLLDVCTEESFRRVSRIINRVAYCSRHVSAITARLREVVEELSEAISSKLLDVARAATVKPAASIQPDATATASDTALGQVATNLTVLPLPTQQLARFHRTLQMLVSLTEKTNGRTSEALALLQVQDLWDALDVLMDTIRTSSGLDDEEETTAAVVRTSSSSSAVVALLLRLLPLIESFCALMGRLATITQARNAPPGADEPPEEGPIPFTRVDSLPGARFRRVASHRSSVHDPDDASDNEYLSRLILFAQAHHTLLNALIQAKPNLLEHTLKPLVDTPQCRVQLSFDNKRAYFRSRLHKMKDPRYMRRTMQLSVRRTRVFEDSFHQLRMRQDNEMLQRLSVSFHGEEGIDAGGLTREWFTVLAREIFNPNYALFTAATDGATFQPNPLSYVNPDHLDYFRFVGRVIGKAIVDEQLMDAHFTVSFYKHVLGLPITHNDMEAVDPEYYKNLKQILDFPLDDLGLDLVFSAEDSRFGKLETIDLLPDGRNKRVTDENKLEYVNLITCHRMTTAIRAQIEAFLEGFHGLVPPELISVFSPAELELLICGLPDVDVEDLRVNTEYHHFQPNDDQITWFWDTLRSFSREDKAQFLQFVTGTSKVPLDGFANLRGVRGPQRFSIHRSYDAQLLPTAHTCFNQLDLPAYDTQEMLREKLLIAIREGHSGFGFA